MNQFTTNERTTGGTCAMRPAKKSPRVVLGLGVSGYTSAAAAQLKAAGWDVIAAAPGEEARREAVRGKAHVMAIRLAADTDVLSAAKVLNALPKKTRLVLVGPADDTDLPRLAVAFGAAAVVSDADGVPALVRAILSVWA